MSGVPLKHWETYTNQSAWPACARWNVCQIHLIYFTYPSRREAVEGAFFFKDKTWKVIGQTACLFRSKRKKVRCLAAAVQVGNSLWFPICVWGSGRRHRPGGSARRGGSVQTKSVSQECKMLPIAGKSLRMPFVIFKCGNDIQVGQSCCCCSIHAHLFGLICLHLLLFALLLLTAVAFLLFIQLNLLLGLRRHFSFPIQFGYAMSKPEKRQRLTVKRCLSDSAL